MLDYWQMPRFCKVAPRLVFGLGVALLGPALGRVWGQTPENVLIVVNDSSPVSRIIGEYTLGSQVRCETSAGSVP